MCKFKRKINSLKYSLKILYEASPIYFTLRITTSIMRSIFPYVLLFIWRQLLNSLTDYFNVEAKQALTTILSNIIVWAVLYIVCIIINKISLSVSNIIQYRYTDEVVFYIDNILVKKISHVDMHYFDSCKDKNEVSFVESNMSSSIQNVANYIIQFLEVILSVIISVYIISTISPMILLPILMFSLPQIYSEKYDNKMRYDFEKNYILESRKIGYYSNFFFGNSLGEIKLFNLHHYFKDKYKKAWEDIRKAKDKMNYKLFLAYFTTRLLAVISDIVILIYCIFLYAKKIIEFGDISYYTSVVARCRESFVAIFSLIINFDDESIRLNDVKTFMERNNIISKSGSLSPPSNPCIEFRNVYFKYPDCKEYVLKNCSFTMNPGEIVGLVGLNGSGKSTIVKLLCRFYDPTDGQILIDGIDAREYDIVKLRALFGVLFQDYVMYSLTLRENIALSDISHMANDDEIIEAVNESRVSDFIGDWHNGIDESMTRQFDPEGKELSGGQWQRVSLARAFFRDAPIVLLDEPSAALDPIAEHEIFNDFAAVSKDKSALLISHRLSSITLADRIIVLDDGHIVENGSHKELLEKNGRYAHLFNLQASKYIHEE